MKVGIKIIIKLNFFVCIIPLLVFAQGVRFQNDLIWESIKNRAKVENKLIFVDCFTTWCGPCKIMDQNVFSDTTVGRVFQDHFICMKLQMDSTATDNEFVKKNYPTVATFMREYKIGSFPTYLFLSDDGILLHKGVGAMPKSEFMTLVSDAITPEKQFYSRIQNWKSGNISNNTLLELVNSVSDLYRDKDLALQMAKDYLLIINKLDDKDFYTVPNLLFLIKYSEIINTNNLSFARVRQKPEKVDSLMRTKRVAESFLKSVLTREIYKPALNNAEFSNTVPDWRELEELIKLKSDKNIARKVIVDAQVNWYLNKRNWDLYFVCLQHQFDLNDMEIINGMYLNYQAWQVFKNSYDKKNIANAIKWVDIAIQKANRHIDSVHWLDTRACLLYKSGERKKALAIEKSYLNQFPSDAEFLRQRIDAMKRNDEIWLYLD
jgi:thioredoxin-related protein